MILHVSQIEHISSKVEEGILVYSITSTAGTTLRYAGSICIEAGELKLSNDLIVH